jgi:fibronectin type 3 domain-containing protein
LQPDGSFDPSTFRDLNATPIVPWPLERWSTIAGQNSKDDMAKIAAQSLYGKNFVPSNGFIHQADEFATRFSFATLAADISPKTATALGLRYVDRDIQKGKTYVYRVTSPVDPKVYVVNPGVVVVNTSDITPVPQAIISALSERQNMIEVKWKRDFHQPYFSAYNIERSDDNGKTFRKLNKLPYMHPVAEKNPVSIEYMIYLDSIPANYKTYWYRLTGITPFGETGAPSATMKAMGKDMTPPTPPQNVKAKHVGGSLVRVTWEYPKKDKEIRGFLIGRGNNPSKEFIPLTTTPLPSKTREFIDKSANTMASNFYIVAVVDTAGNASASLAQYAMMVDSIPPAAPSGLAGTIDTLGHVTVTWRQGPERDIRGYNVFYSNQKDHEYSLLTKSPLLDTVYRDTITIKTLTKKIYYKVVAIDYNSNYSKFSQALELKKPDVVPPTAAVMSDYKVTETGIELRWVPSTSEDLAKTVLYRMEGSSKEWKEIATYKANQELAIYTDTTGLRAGNMYTYSLVCFDEDGLTSKRSVPIKIRYADFKSRVPVNTISAKPDDKSIFVNWNYPVKGEYRFVLYRAVNGSAFDSYRSLEGSVTTFSDKDVKKGAKYEYSVGVIYKDGKKAPFGGIAKTVF